MCVCVRCADLHAPFCDTAAPIVTNKELRRVQDELKRTKRELEVTKTQLTTKREQLKVVFEHIVPRVTRLEVSGLYISQFTSHLFLSQDNINELSIGLKMAIKSYPNKVEVCVVVRWSLPMDRT